jgi:hypothetical protein
VSQTAKRAVITIAQEGAEYVLAIKGNQPAMSRWSMSVAHRPGTVPCDPSVNRRSREAVTQILHLVRTLIWVNESVHKQEHGVSGDLALKLPSIDMRQPFRDLHH